MSVAIQLRRDTAANWTSANPILNQGELGVETDTGKIKIGDGATHWASLLYFDGGGGAVSSVAAADASVVVSPTTGSVTVHTGTLDAIATARPPAASVPMNSHKFTGLANGSASSDSAAFGQIPTVDTTAGDFAASPGTAAAGSAGKVADAGHVHPQPALFAPTGLTGAVQASRYVGATSSGAPVSGTFATGDYVVDRSGAMWVCTTGGTPGTWAQIGASGHFAGLLTPTGVKTSAYSAAPGDYVPVDTTSAAVTITLPAAPADLTVVGVKLIALKVPNAVTIAAAGSDVFNKASGSVSLTLTVLNQGFLLQYNAASAIWYVMADDLMSIPDTSALYSSATRLPVVPQPTAVVTDFQSGHGWTGLAAGGSTYNVNDTTAGDFIVGSQAASATTDGGGTNYASIRRLAAYTLNGVGMNVRVRFMIPDATHLAQINVFLGNSSLASNYKWIAHRPGATYITSGDWITCTLSWADAATTGSPTRSALTDAELQVLDDAGGTVTVHWQTLELIPDGRATFPKGLVSITFDDSFSSPMTQGAWATMDANGWPGSLFLIQDALGTGGCIQLSDVLERADVFGWEVAGHAYTGADHNTSDTGLTAQQLDTDARNQRAWLAANGIRCADGYAYPLGNFGLTTDSQSVIGILRRYYSWSRLAGATAHETWPPADKYRIRSVSNITSFTGGVTAAAVNTLIDNAAANGGWLVLVFHKIVNTTPATLLECSITDFNTIMTHLASSGVPVLTMGDALRHYSGETPAIDTTAADIQALAGSAGAGASGLTADAKHVHPNTGLLTTGTAVTIAQGGTGQVAQQAAMDAIAGATTSGDYLRGNGTHVAMSAIQAGDVPTLNQDTTGKSAKTDALNSASTVVNVSAATAPSAGQVLTAVDSTHATWQPAAGGVQSLTFTYGSTGAVPSSGTFTAGAVAVDQNNIPRICTASGTPGSWRRLYAQPYDFYIDDYGAKGDGVKCLVTTVAGNATITAATPVFTNTGVDGGKNLMICGAGGGIPGGPDVDTIATVTDSTHAVLSSNVPAGGSATGAACVFSSDDRVAIDNCITAAQTYAVAHGFFARVLFSSKIYGLGTGLFQSTAGVAGATLSYNVQIRMAPGTDFTGESGKLEIQYLGPTSGAQCRFWTANVGEDAPGTVLMSYSTGPNAADPTYGQQAIMGMPIGGTGQLEIQANFFNVKAVVKGITLVQPGWSNSIGLDLYTASQHDISVTSSVFAPSTNDGGGINPYIAWYTTTFWIDNKIGVGVRLPRSQNNDQCESDICVQGLNIALIAEADHIILHRLSVAAVDGVIKMNVGGDTQHSIEGRVSAENYNTGIVTTGVTSRVMCELTWDAEQTSGALAGYDVNDPANNLYGTLNWSDFSRNTGGLANIIVPTVSGAQNLRIRNVQLTQQVYDASAYSYTLGAAFQNPWWENMWVTIAGGTVSGITIGPTSAAATTTVPTAAYPGFKLPTGWWINIAGSVKPTTFYAVPD